MAPYTRILSWTFALGIVLVIRTQADSSFSSTMDILISSTFDDELFFLTTDDSDDSADITDTPITSNDDPLQSEFSTIPSQQDESTTFESSSSTTQEFDNTDKANTIYFITAFLIGGVLVLFL